MNARHIKILLFLLMVPFLMGSQTLSYVGNNTQPESEIILNKINEFYSSNHYIFQELSYQLFPDHTSKIPFSSEKGKYIKQGKKQYSQLSEIESLTTDNYTIGVDHDEKMVMIANHISIPATGPIADAKSWVSSGSDFIINTVSDRLQSLTINLEYGEIEKIDLIYNIDSYQPVKLVMNYRRSIQLETDPESPFVQPRLEIDYTNTSYDGKERVRLNTDAYLIYKNKQWTLAPKYRKYELINNIQELPFHH